VGDVLAWVLGFLASVLVDGIREALLKRRAGRWQRAGRLLGRARGGPGHPRHYRWGALELSDLRWHWRGGWRQPVDLAGSTVLTPLRTAIDAGPPERALRVRDPAGRELTIAVLQRQASALAAAFEHGAVGRSQPRRVWRPWWEWLALPLLAGRSGRLRGWAGRRWTSSHVRWRRCSTGWPGGTT